jgi:hypothetical protein
MPPGCGVDAAPCRSTSWVVSKAIAASTEQHRLPLAKEGVRAKMEPSCNPTMQLPTARPMACGTAQMPRDGQCKSPGGTGLHVKQARYLEMTVMRVVRPSATNKERDPRVSWFVWIGDQEADVVQVALGYVLRFGQEHGYRFDKQCLLWEQPRLRTPEQFERWSQIVAIAHNHLVLARDLVHAQLRPWENKQRVPTPQQVRRGMHKLLARLGTPTRAPHSRGKSKGRKKGVHVKKAPRFPVIRKTPKVPQLVPS